jgi:hypothetical protein
MVGSRCEKSAFWRTWSVPPVTGSPLTPLVLPEVEPAALQPVRARAVVRASPTTAKRFFIVLISLFGDMDPDGWCK